MLTVTGSGGVFPWVCHICGETDDRWSKPRLCVPIVRQANPGHSVAVDLVGVCEGCVPALKEKLGAQEVAEDIEGAFGDRSVLSEGIDTAEGAALNSIAQATGLTRITATIPGGYAEPDVDLRRRIKQHLGLK